MGELVTKNCQMYLSRKMLFVLKGKNQANVYLMVKIQASLVFHAAVIFYFVLHSGPLQNTSSALERSRVQDT